jgi:Zn-dependent protease
MSTQISQFFSFIFAILLSVIVHEVAHGWVALQRGDPTARDAGRLTANPLAHLDLWGSFLVPLLLWLSPGSFVFGWARPVPVNHARLRDPDRDSMLVALAGPVSNLLLALVGAVLLGLVGGAASHAGLPLHAADGSGGFLLRALTTLIAINTFLALFNLVPIPPLDGSWVLSPLLPRSMRRGYESVRPYGMFILLGLLLLGAFRFILGAAFSLIDVYLGISGAVAQLL